MNIKNITEINRNAWNEALWCLKEKINFLKTTLICGYLFFAATTVAHAQRNGTTGNLSWSISGDTLTISGNGDMPDYTYRDWAPWDSFRRNITAVLIEYGVTRIGNTAFAFCSNITSVVIPNSVTSIGVRAFLLCTSLTSITIPNSVTHIEQAAFGGCRSLTSIIIPNSVTEIGIGAFNNTGLKSIIIPESVTIIRMSTFGECSDLTSVTIPNSITTIEDLAFADCIKLTSVTIPASVTSIGGRVFEGCTGLTSITIPSSVISIGNYAFAWCIRLVEIINHATTPQTINTNVFEGVSLSVATLRVPAASIDAYRAAEGWKDFGNIVAIEIINFENQ